MSYNHCQQPVFDSHPPELYGSLGAEASQRNGGGGYLQASESLAVEGNSPSEGQNTGSGYMTLREQEREPSNEYDYIPGDPTLEPPLLGIAPPAEMRGGEGSATLEKKRNGGGGSPPDSGAAPTTSGGRKVMKNSMYENHDVKPLLHPTLTGPEAKGVVEGVGVRGGERCTCSTKSLVQAFLLAMTMLLAVASLGLSGLMWFGVNNNKESPTDAAVYTPEMTQCSCPESIDLLEAELMQLRSALEQMNNSVFQAQAQLSSEASILPAALESLQDLSSEVINTTSLFHSQPSIDVLVNASPIYDSCVTIVKDSCTLPETAETNNCTTDFIHTNTSGSYELNSLCRYRQHSGVENTALMGTLETREEDSAVRCSCLRLGGDSTFYEMECQLVVTSCPLQWDLSSSGRVV